MRFSKTPRHTNRKTRRNKKKGPDNLDSLKYKIHAELIPYVNNWIGIGHLFTSVNFTQHILSRTSKSDACNDTAINKCTEPCDIFYNASYQATCVTASRINTISEQGAIITGKNNEKYRVIYSKYLKHTYWYIILENINSKDIYIGIPYGYWDANSNFWELVDHIYNYIKSNYIDNKIASRKNIILFGHSNNGGQAAIKVLEKLSAYNPKFCSKHIILLTSGCCSTVDTNNPNVVMKYKHIFNCVVGLLIDNDINILLIDNRYAFSIFSNETHLYPRIYPEILIIKNVITSTHECYIINSEKDFEKILNSHNIDRITPNEQIHKWTYYIDRIKAVINK